MHFPDVHSLQNCYYYSFNNGKDEFRKCLYWMLFHKANSYWKCFHHSQQGRSAPLCHTAFLCKLTLCSNPALLRTPHLHLCIWTWLEKTPPPHWRSTSHSSSLARGAPCCYAAIISYFLNWGTFHLLGACFGLPAPTSHIVSPASIWADDLALSFTEE